YDAKGQLEAKVRNEAGHIPMSVAVNAQTGALAVGFDDTMAVEVYDGTSLKRLYAADTRGLQGVNLSNVAWSQDGARLYAGGRIFEKVNPVFVWQNQGRGQRKAAPLTRDLVAELLPCGSNMAIGAADPAFGLIDANGQKRVWQDSVTADMRD